MTKVDAGYRVLCGMRSGNRIGVAAGAFLIGFTLQAVSLAQPAPPDVIPFLQPTRAAVNDKFHLDDSGAVLGNNVESLLNYARQHNPEYAGTRYDAQAAGERIGSAGALADPVFRADVMDVTQIGQPNPMPGPFGGTIFSIKQEVPWFGKRDLKREIAEAEAEGANFQVRGAWLDISSRIKIAYAQLYFVQRNEQLTREVLKLMQQLEKVANARYSGGSGNQQDVIRAQTEQTAMRNELVSIDNERRQAQARLNSLLSRPAQAPLAAPEALRTIPPAEKVSLAALDEQVRRQNPQISLDDTRVRSSEKNRDLAYKNRYPDVTVGVLQNQYQNAFNQWGVMLELNIPIQQDARRSREREAEAMVSAAQARRTATANQILSNLAETLSALDAARETDRLVTTSLLPQAQATYDSALEGYKNGKVDFATLLEAQRQIRIARLNLLKAKTDSQVRLAELERILGEDL